jgi:hypothetical protein
MRINEITDLEITAEKKAERERILAAISTNCTEILNIYKKTPGRYLYRGLYAFQPFMYSTIDKNRQPTDLDPKIQKIFDRTIKEFGGVAARGNSIFCTPSSKVASNWGSNVYVVFPVDGFHATMFPDFKPSLYNDYIYYDLSALSGYTINDIAMHCAELLRSYEVNFQKSFLLSALKMKNEILISGEGYYAVNRKYLHLLRPLIRNTP